LKDDIPKDFKFAGTHCGVKKKRKDVGIIFSEVDALTCGVFTKNVVKAAPVIYDEKILKQREIFRAIIVNSGIANACTGERGLKDAEEMARMTADSLGLKKEEILVSSTGVIGANLPMEKIKKGVETLSQTLGNSWKNVEDFANSIMTTDRFPKISTKRLEIKGKTVKILGIAKGAGMIHPNMATMLAFVVCDINITRRALCKVLRESVDRTYNMISVDGDTSTNDMVIVMANGKAENEVLDLEDEEFQRFFDAFNNVNENLAKMIVKDGEGATKVFEVVVRGARSLEEAKKIVRTILSSNLVKTAVYGSDPNWGRIIASAGYSGVEFDPNLVDLYLESIDGDERIALMLKGEPVEFDESKAKMIMSRDEFRFTLDMNSGNISTKGWGCDLTEKYVEINGRYRT